MEKRIFKFLSDFAASNLSGFLVDSILVKSGSDLVLRRQFLLGFSVNKLESDFVLLKAKLSSLLIFCF